MLLNNIKGGIIMRLILARHGETQENVADICQGQSNGCLTEWGRFQAHKLGERLKDREIDVFYCSFFRDQLGHWLSLFTPFIILYTRFFIHIPRVDAILWNIITYLCLFYAFYG